MARTPIRAKIVPRLNALNDQLRFFLFLEHEFVTCLENFGPAIGTAYTSDLFTKNPHAPRIHVRLEALSKFRSENRSQTFGAYFSTIYEVASDFFDDAEDLLKQVRPATYVQGKVSQGGPEDRYEATLLASAVPGLDSNLIQTMSYMRHRRNAFIHLHTTPSNAYQQFSSEKGANLNAYWGQTRASLDFTDATVSNISEANAIDLVKLIRISIERLDDHLAEQLTEEEMAAYVAAAEYAGMQTRLNKAVLEERIREISGWVNAQFGVACHRAAAEAAAKHFGVR